MQAIDVFAILFGSVIGWGFADILRLGAIKIAEALDTVAARWKK